MRRFHIDTDDHGDCTDDINHRRAPHRRVPHRPLPRHARTSASLNLIADTANSLASLESTLIYPYPVPPPPQMQPAQEPGRSPRPSGVVVRRR